MKTILLSFDLEEFDMPLEYNRIISFDKQIKASQTGTEIILETLKKFNINATFFCTYTFAMNSKHLVAKLCSDHHELASHGYFHSLFEENHLEQSKKGLEDISGQQVFGFRMPRMKPVNLATIKDAGYYYDSSLNPVYIPGRYNNFSKPRVLFKSENLWELPASATPALRVPLFWLSFHHFPLWFYKLNCSLVSKHDNYLNIYFHPWEFIDLGAFGLPHFLTKNSGTTMIQRFESWILWLKSQGFNFSTINNFLQDKE